MWHDQGECVTCWQFSVLIFQYKLLVNKKCYILIPIPSQSDIWLQRYEQFFHFKNNVKHKNLSHLLACNSISIFPTSDSFSLIMSHICMKNNMFFTEKVTIILPCFFKYCICTAQRCCEQHGKYFFLIYNNTNN